MNGVRYASNVIGQSLRASLHDKGLFYERKYEIDRSVPRYESKLGFASPAQAALDRIPADSVVLDLGSSDGHLAGALKRRDAGSSASISPNRSPLTGSTSSSSGISTMVCRPRAADRRVVMADVIEHLRAPEDFAEKLAEFCRMNGVRQLLVSTGNVAFAVQRVMLLLGQFNYGRRGILDMTHTRLFTVRTIRRLFRQAGFSVRETFGIPAPFPLATRSAAARAPLGVNQAAIGVSTALFSYQIFLVLDPPPDLGRVIAESAAFAPEP